MNLTLQENEDKNLQELKDTLKSLYVIWNDVGVDDEGKIDRANQVFGYVLQLVKDIHEEEIWLFEDIKERIKNYEIKISELARELNLPPSEEIVGPLIVREESLRQQLDELSKLKHKRMREFQELRAQEMKYCKILGMSPIALSSTTGVPNENDIFELKQHIKMLREEKDTREKKFYSLKKELTTILEVTELTPDTPLEKEILSSKEESFSLSSETFKILQNLVIKTKNKKAELENEKAVLMDKLFILWDVLKVGKEGRNIFLSEHIDCRVSNLNAIKAEISRCEKIKRQNISKYIDALKEELSCLWKTCFISKSTKKSVLLQHEDENNETVLEIYDNEVAKWRKYYKDTEHIIQKINKRQELWDLMIVFENKVNDPNRFKNRGGNLLQEERERRRLQKELPALEKEIFLEIEKYEKETGKLFLYFGDTFRMFVEKQWEERLAQKENEKVMRQKLRSQTIEDSRILGKTTLKRPLNARTPKSAPSKLLKSNVGLSIRRTPIFTVGKPVPSTTDKRRTTRQMMKQPSIGNNVLKKKNENIDGGNAMDSTTYTDFAEKLERSSRYAYRSSVLCSKKIGGTRISTSNKKRKSVSKFAQKSISKKDSSKITPARGKAGQPFLI